MYVWIILKVPKVICWICKFTEVDKSWLRNASFTIGIAEKEGNCSNELEKIIGTLKCDNETEGRKDDDYKNSKISEFHIIDSDSQQSSRSEIELVEKLKYRKRKKEKKKKKKKRSHENSVSKRYVNSSLFYLS